jgi:hypothetical protein
LDTVQALPDEVLVSEDPCALARVVDLDGPSGSRKRLAPFPAASGSVIRTFQAFVVAAEANGFRHLQYGYK